MSNWIGIRIWKECRFYQTSIKGNMLKTITTDNGSGFSEHEWIKNLGVSVYFTDNHYSMQKV